MQKLLNIPRMKFVWKRRSMSRKLINVFFIMSKITDMMYTFVPCKYGSVKGDSYTHKY